MNNEGKNNSRLTNALVLLARNFNAMGGGQGGGRSDNGLGSTTSLMPANPELAVLQSAQKLIGLRPGFSVSELTAALEQHFRPVQDEEGTDTFEYVPTSAATYSTTPMPMTEGVDELEQQFLSAAQALVPQAEVLLSELIQAFEDDGQANEAREALSISLNTFTTAAMSRADAAVVAGDLTAGLQALGLALGLVTRGSGKLVPAVTAEHRTLTAKYLLLRGSIESINAAWSGLNDLRNNDPLRTIEQIEAAFRTCVENVRDLNSSESLFGERWNLDDFSFGLNSTSDDSLNQTTLQEIMQAFTAFAGGEASRLLKAGGSSGSASVQRRVTFFLNAFRQALQELSSAQRTLSSGVDDDLASDFISQKVDELLRHLQYVNSLLSKLDKTEPRTTNDLQIETHPEASHSDFRKPGSNTGEQSRTGEY